MKGFSIKFKIIVTTILCVALVSFGSNLFLYNYLSHIIEQKAERIDQMYLDTLRNQLNQHLVAASELAILCANDAQVSSALNRSDDFSSAGMRAALSAQTSLNVYLSACNVETYIDKLVVFNTNGLVVQGSCRQSGLQSDYASITSLPMYLRAVSPGFRTPYLVAVSKSIAPRGDRVLALLCPVRGVGSKPQHSFLYIELGLDLFRDTLEPYTRVNNIFLASAAGDAVTPLPAGLPADLSPADLKDGLNILDGKSYSVSRTSLAEGGLVLYSCALQTQFGSEGWQIVYVVVVVLITSLCLAAVLAVVVSTYLTKPIHRLNDRLRRIAANDFSFDPDIERGNDELGQMGRVVNEMCMSIDHLLHETEAMYEVRKNTEIALLQSQVNPHFLYNTLDSIHWMAVIQKNSGIAGMTHSLSNLLKNIAKGTQDRIPLREELDLLEDYVAIQNVRYLETFTFHNEVPESLYCYRIVKLTLQPLVENAIFHGIEPTGECGVITLSGCCEGGDILLSVEDDGMGIPPEKLATLLTVHTGGGRASLNGIGIANVHKRLQLNYGSAYGLTIESEVDRFTRVTARIPKEE